jgi:hypothetical protein
VPTARAPANFVKKGTIKSYIYGAYLLMLERALPKLVEKSRARVELVGALRP